jgi:hypothetical protein
VVRRSLVVVAVLLALSALPATAAEAPPEIGYSPTTGPTGTLVVLTNVPLCTRTDFGTPNYGIGLSQTEADTAAATQKYDASKNSVEFVIPNVPAGDYFIVSYCENLSRSLPFHVGLVTPTPMTIQPTFTG